MIHRIKALHDRGAACRTGRSPGNEHVHTTLFAPEDRASPMWGLRACATESRVRAARLSKPFCSHYQATLTSVT